MKIEEAAVKTAVELACVCARLDNQGVKLDPITALVTIPGGDGRTVRVRVGSETSIQEVIVRRKQGKAS